MKSIAIIGSGISGLAAAYLLKDNFDVSIYEKNSYFGGHARTVEVKEPNKHVAIDTGFIVFNFETYPHLTGLFKHLNIPIQRSDMSFGVSINNGALEYGSKSLRHVFCQRRNIANLYFLKMLKDIMRFNKKASYDLFNENLAPDVSLEDYLATLNVSTWFINYYLLAMGAAIWSTPLRKMYDFPAKTFIRFFYNHGLLNISKPVQWYTVKGGSQTYTNTILDKLEENNVKTYPGAKIVIRRNDKVIILDTEGNIETYDKVIFCTHSDEALNLIEEPTHSEKEILKAIRYQKNHMILHSDESFMPHKKKAWSSWVYLSENTTAGSAEHLSLTYWMNNLQNLETQEQYFVSINPSRRPKRELIHDEHTFMHPMFDKSAIKAQEKIQSIQGQHNTYFCGAYLGYGFHEDGVLSAVNVCKALGVETPW